MFRRSVELFEEVENRRGRTYRRSLGAGLWSRNREDRNRQVSITFKSLPVGDRVVLEVSNLDNAPLKLSDFQAFYRTPGIVFKTAGGVETRLYYGNAKASAPRYDIDLVADEMMSAEKSDCQLGGEEALADGWWQANAPSGSLTVVFWICLGAVVLVLLWVIAKLAPEKP